MTMDSGLVAVVEDSAFLLEAWGFVLGHGYRLFPTPSAVMAALAAEPALLGCLTCVVTDMVFDDDVHDGAWLAARLRQLRPDLPVLLSSEVPAPAGSAACFTAQIGKDPLDRSALAALTASSGR